MPDIDKLTSHALAQLADQTPCPEIIDGLCEAHGATVAAQVLERVLHALGHEVRVRVRH